MCFDFAIFSRPLCLLLSHSRSLCHKILLVFRTLTTPDSLSLFVYSFHPYSNRFPNVVLLLRRFMNLEKYEICFNRLAWCGMTWLGGGGDDDDISDYFFLFCFISVWHIFVVVSIAMLMVNGPSSFTFICFRQSVCRYTHLFETDRPIDSIGIGWWKSMIRYRKINRRHFYWLLKLCRLWLDSDHQWE